MVFDGLIAWNTFRASARSAIFNWFLRKIFSSLSDERQQTRWPATVGLAFPAGGFVGVGRGVVIVAYNGNRAAASAGAAAVNGAVVPVGV